MFNIGPLELIIVLIIALIVLGPKKLPEVGRSVGKGMREFKAAISGGRSDDDDPLAGIEWDEHGEFPDFDEELELERGDGGEDPDRRHAPGDGSAERHDREQGEFDRVQAEEEARARQEFS